MQSRTAVRIQTQSDDSDYRDISSQWLIVQKVTHGNYDTCLSAVIIGKKF